MKEKERKKNTNNEKMTLQIRNNHINSIFNRYNIRNHNNNNNNHGIKDNDNKSNEM